MVQGATSRLLDAARRRLGDLNSVGGGVPAAEEGWTGDFNETFDSATEDNTWAQITAGTTWTSGYSTTQIWDSSNSLYNVGYRKGVTISDQTEVYMSFVFRASAGAAYAVIGGLRDQSGDADCILMRLETWSTDHWTNFRYYIPSGNNTVTLTINLNTTYWVLFHYKTGSGTGVAQIYITSTQPTTATGWGSAAYSKTDGNWSTAVDSIQVGASNSTIVIDEVRANYSATVIYYD